MGLSHWLQSNACLLKVIKQVSIETKIVIETEESRRDSFPPHKEKTRAQSISFPAESILLSIHYVYIQNRSLSIVKKKLISSYFSFSVLRVYFCFVNILSSEMEKKHLIGSCLHLMIDLKSQTIFNTSSFMCVCCFFLCIENIIDLISFFALFAIQLNM